jgi:amino acid permease
MMAMSVAAEISASTLIQFWNKQVNPAAWISTFVAFLLP